MKRPDSESGLFPNLFGMQSKGSTGSAPYERENERLIVSAARASSGNKQSQTLSAELTEMIQTDPIFLGVVPRGARNYVAEQIVRLDRPFFNACAGRFSVVEAAVKQGFPAANVHASDIGLFSSIIGYLADDSKRLEDLGIRILDPDLAPRDMRGDLDFAAQVMLILKLNQMSQRNLRGLYLREDEWASAAIGSLFSCRSRVPGRPSHVVKGRP